MSGIEAARDWTQDVPAICYQACASCGARWYFRKRLCAACGSRAVESRPASGRGVVYARTLVTRAPRAELRAATPYCILLVDAEENFRLMAQGDAALEIGDQVSARFVTFDGCLIPYFERAIG